MVVVGSANADLFVESRLPLAGETLAATGGGVVLAGGKGANQAAAAALLGASCVLVCQTGSDVAGTLVRDALAGAGVRLEHAVTLPSTPTGQAVIILQPGGQNSIIIVGGANMAWERPSDAALEAVRAAKVLLLQREVPESVSLAAAEAAHAAGVPVVLDFGGDESPVSPRLLELCTVVSPNETELARVTRRPAEEEKAVEEAARNLLETVHGGAGGGVLVKRGAEGSMWLEHGGAAPAWCPAASFDTVVDTTGAGDCFTSAWAVARYVDGRAPAAAASFAAAAAALCVQKPGALPSMPTRAEVDAAIARHGQA